MGKNILGIIFSAVAGSLMSIQGVFNTRSSEKIGLFETNLIVQGSAFILTLILFLLFGNGGLKKLTEVNKLYFLGGAIGVIITYSVMKGIGELSPTYAISIILVSQLITASLIDCCGLFETKQLQFHISKIIGVIIMVLGIIIFKWK